MTMRFTGAAVAVAAFLLPLVGSAQGRGPGGPGGQGGPGGPGMQAERKVLEQFDKDGNKRLNAEERRAARLWLAEQPTQGPGGRGGGRQGRGGIGGPGGSGGRGGMVAGTPGPKVSPASVKTYGSEPFYDPSVLRTLFFTFENDEWEQELMAFNNTDVEVPATLTVDGKALADVGVHFRGASSFFSVPEGLKHSMNISIDFVHEDQSFQDYTTLNLLNANGDPSLLKSVLYLQAAREYGPAPKANFVRVVLNGESWGIFTSAQQFNKQLIKERFSTTDGARWKVPGSPNGRGGLEYLGDDVAAYKGLYEIKSKDTPKPWEDLVRLTKVLNTAPLETLEQALAPMINVDGVLKFLALEIVLINSDGYWTRASDYSLYQDVKGVFHIIPHDANETFGPGGGGRGVGVGRGPVGPPPGGGPPGGLVPPDGIGRQGRGGGRGGMGPGGGGVTLDPLIGLDDTSKPLRSRLLAVPSLRARYMTYVRDISDKWLDWKNLGPIAQRYHTLIAADVKADTRKLSTNEAFDASLAALKTFADERRAFLAAYKER